MMRDSMVTGLEISQHKVTTSNFGQLITYAA